MARHVVANKSPDHGDVSNDDLTHKATLLLNICSNPEGDRRHIAEALKFVDHGPAPQCIDQETNEEVELKEGDHIVEHGKGVRADPNLNWHMSYPTYIVTRPKSKSYPIMVKRVVKWDDCEHSWHCMHPTKVNKACVDRLLKPRCNKGSCVVPSSHSGANGGEWLCQKLTTPPDEVDAAAIASAGGARRLLRRRLRKQRSTAAQDPRGGSYLNAHTADRMLPPLEPDGGAAPAKASSAPKPVVPFTPPLPADWFASFSEKKQKGLASEKLHKKVYATVPDKSTKAAEHGSSVYLASDGVHCSHDFRVSEEVSDDECAARVSALLDPADANEVLGNAVET